MRTDAVTCVAGPTLLALGDRASEGMARMVRIASADAGYMRGIVSDRRWAVLAMDVADEAWRKVEQAVQACAAAGTPAVLVLRGPVDGRTEWARMRRAAAALGVDVVHVDASVRLDGIVELCAMTALSSRRERWMEGAGPTCAVARSEHDGWWVTTATDADGAAVDEHYPVFDAMNVRTALRRVFGRVDMRFARLNDAIGLGYEPLDALCAGYEVEDVVVVAGPRGAGKSRVALEVATHVGHREPAMPVFYVAPGQNSIDVAERMTAARANIAHWQLIRGVLSRADMHALTHAANHLASARMAFVEMGAMTREDLDVAAGAWLEAAARRYCCEGPGLIVIDDLDALAIRLDQSAPDALQTVADLARRFACLALVLVSVDEDVPDGDFALEGVARAIVRLHGTPNPDGTARVRGARYWERG